MITSTLKEYDIKEIGAMLLVMSYLQAYQPTPLNRLTKKIKKSFVI
jgi:hypothetical protein